MYPAQGWNLQPFRVCDDAQPAEPLSQGLCMCVLTVVSNAEDKKRGIKTKILTTNRGPGHKDHYGLCFVLFLQL